MNVRTFTSAAAALAISFGALFGLAATTGAATATAAPVLFCGQFSHPVLVSPTKWGCSVPSISNNGHTHNGHHHHKHH